MSEDLAIFNDLSDAEREEIISSGKLRRFKKGETVFIHGDKLKSFYIITSGALRKFRQTPDGKEVTIGIAMRGDIVGGTHMFDSCTSYQWGGVAVEDSELLEFPVEKFKERAKANSRLLLNILAALSHNTNQSAIEAEHLVTLSAPQRVACFLMRLCSLYDFDPKDFTLPYSKTTIASKLGMELETFSRSVGKLKQHGAEISGAQVKINNLHALECYVCGHCSIAEDCETLAHMHKNA